MQVKDFDRLPTIHYTQMPEPQADSPTYGQVMAFRRELPRLLAEGNEGKWALITKDQVIEVYPTFDEACNTGYERLLRGFIVQLVREWQPVLRMRY
jgi:hypothetical protein